MTACERMDTLLYNQAVGGAAVIGRWRSYIAHDPGRAQRPPPALFVGDQQDADIVIGRHDRRADLRAGDADAEILAVWPHRACVCSG